MSGQLYSTSQACRLAGVTYRQADYWCRTGAMRPMLDARGSGSCRRYTEDEVVALAVVGALAEMGAERDDLERAGREVMGRRSGVLVLEPGGQALLVDADELPIVVELIGAAWVVDVARTVAAMRDEPLLVGVG